MSNLWNVCRQHFRGLGYKCKPSQVILDYITYKFDKFEKGDEQFLQYVLDKEDSFSSVVETAKVIVSTKTDTIIRIVIPSSISVTAAHQQVAADNNIGLCVVDEGSKRFTELTKGLTKVQIEKSAQKIIREILSNINRITKTKFGITLFIIKTEIIDSIRPTAKDKDQFISQVAAFSSILGLINKMAIIKNTPPSSKLEREMFSQNQTIKILGFFLKKKKIDYAFSAIKDLQSIKFLRNIPPIYPRGVSSKIARELLRRTPRTNDDWYELSQIIFSKFQGALILLRNQLRN